VLALNNGPSPSRAEVAEGASTQGILKKLFPKINWSSSSLFKFDKGFKKESNGTDRFKFSSSETAITLVA
jgi:hypothetical protein